MSLSPAPRSPIRPMRISSEEAVAKMGKHVKRDSIVPELGEISGQEEEVEVR